MTNILYGLTYRYKVSWYIFAIRPMIAATLLRLKIRHSTCVQKNRFPLRHENKPRLADAEVVNGLKFHTDRSFVLHSVAKSNLGMNSTYSSKQYTTPQMKPHQSCNQIQMTSIVIQGTRLATDTKTLHNRFG